MEVNLKSLPRDIYKKIPLSIRAYSDTYEFNDLPIDIQTLIKPYVSKQDTLTYKEVFDLIPEISQYGDFEIISSKKKLVIEYLKNYLLTLPNDYPFDPTFGSTLRKHLHMRDTNTRKLLIDNDIQNIVRIISIDLEIPIQLLGVGIKTSNQGIYSKYDIQISLLVEDEEVSIGTTVVF